MGPVAALQRHPLRVLLVLVPLAPALRHLVGAADSLVFASSALAVVPLAAEIGRITERLADRWGEGVGGLVHATFGNAAEFIIAILALAGGHYALVKASITGSILANVLLVFGVGVIYGGLRHETLRFNRKAANLTATMLVLSVIALVVPAVFHLAVAPGHRGRDLDLSVLIAVVLLVTYLLSLVFALRTHRHLYTDPHAGEAEADGAGRDGAGGDGSAASSPEASLPGDLLVLAGATAAVVWMSELLVDTTVAAARELGMSEVFVGVVVVALVGNAAERSAVLPLAGEGRMDAVIQATVGSSIQIALFVAPVLLFLSYLVGPRPMDLEFTTLEVMAVTVSAGIMTFIAQGGETHWMNGVQLVAVYLILAVAFYLA
ncbi:MAG: calcium/proton exchanger [Gemmatimonadota bacterium]